METKKFVNQAAQGDVWFKRVNALPENVKKAYPKDGVYVVAHSETGHHHVIDAQPGVEYYESEDSMTAYLRVIDATEVSIKHLRSFDTHKTVEFLKGIFRFRRPRERTPEGWRRIED